MKCTNCGKELLPGAMFCAACGTKVLSELPETDDQKKHKTKNKKNKKKHTRLIGIVVVSIAVVAVGFGGIKVWQKLHLDSEKQLIYSKNGVLYYNANMDTDNDSIKIYDAKEETASFDVAISQDQKYLFFTCNEDQNLRLYCVKMEKLTSDESKNEKCIKKVDDKVKSFETYDDGILYERIKNDNDRENFDLCYYDGEKIQDIDDDVYKYHREEKIIYYFKDYAGENSYTLSYYDLNDQKQGDIDGGCSASESIYYAENRIVFAKSAEKGESDALDIYMAVPGGTEQKIASGIADFSCDLDTENIYYTKLRAQGHPYSTYVKDSCMTQDQEMEEPDVYDYGYTVDPIDVLPESEYEYYYEDFDTAYDYVSEEGEYDDYVGDYVYEVNGKKYIETLDDYWYEWFCISDYKSYVKQEEAYEKAKERMILRDELEVDTYGQDTYDLYLYNSKSGEKKIAESVSEPFMDAKGGVCFYSKIKDIKEEKVCSIKDIKTVSDLEKYLDDANPQDDTVYVMNGEKEQKLEDKLKNFNVSADGKTVMASIKGKENTQLIAYSKNENNIEKIGTVEERYRNGEFIGNDFYYYDDDHTFYIYSGGKSKKIAENVNGFSMQIQEDGVYTFFNINDDDLQILEKNGDKDTIRDVGQYKNYAYMDKNHILYKKSDDLYLYNGNESKRIDRNVTNFWCKNRLTDK